MRRRKGTVDAGGGVGPRQLGLIDSHKPGDPKVPGVTTWAEAIRRLRAAEPQNTNATWTNRMRAFGKSGGATRLSYFWHKGTLWLTDDLVDVMATSGGPKRKGPASIAWNAVPVIADVVKGVGLPKEWNLKGLHAAVEAKCGRVPDPKKPNRGCVQLGQFIRDHLDAFAAYGLTAGEPTERGFRYVFRAIPVPEVKPPAPPPEPPPAAPAPADQQDASQAAAQQGGGAAPQATHHVVDGVGRVRPSGLGVLVAKREGLSPYGAPLEPRPGPFPRPAVPSLLDLLSQKLPSKPDHAEHMALLREQNAHLEQISKALWALVKREPKLVLTVSHEKGE